MIIFSSFLSKGEIMKKNIGKVFLFLITSTVFVCESKKAVNSNNFDYQAYWEQRYVQGKTSGDGSYGLLAQFKADIINNFVRENGISSIIEIGCGDGAQLSLMHYPKYLGMDVSKKSIELCQRAFKDDKTKSFMIYDPRYFEKVSSFMSADLVVCLDVLYHIIDESDFIKTLDDTFGLAKKFVILYTTTKERPSFVAHILHRDLFSYLTKYSDFSVIEVKPNKYPDKSLSEFVILKKN
jgi:hypothetical protein